jgi:hypothetical protein
MENRQFSSMRKPNEKDDVEVVTNTSMSDPITQSGCDFPLP